MTSPDSKIQRHAKDFGGWRLYVTETVGNVVAISGVTGVQRAKLMPSRSRAFECARRGLGAHDGGSPRPSRRLDRALETLFWGTLRFALAGLGGRRRMQPRLRHAPFAAARVLGRTSARFRVDSTPQRNVSGGLRGALSSCVCLRQAELGTYSRRFALESISRIKTATISPFRSTSTKPDF
jgi:hypothetical protein